MEAWDVQRSCFFIKQRILFTGRNSSKPSGFNCLKIWRHEIFSYGFFLFIISFAQVNFWETKNSQIVLEYFRLFMGERMNHDDDQSVDSTIKNKGIFPGLLSSLLLFHQSKKHIFVTLYACWCGSGSCIHQTESAELIWFLDPDPGSRKAPKTKKIQFLFWRAGVFT